MLPQSPPAVPGLEMAAHMRTANEVGGDYYDFYPQPDGAVYVVVGDATGHSLAAGMMVAVTKAALKAISVQPPDQSLVVLNRVIRGVSVERMKMALNVVYIDGSTVTVSSAGMPPVLHYHSDTDEVREILIPGLPLGALDEAAYEIRTLELEPGDVLVLVSDGLPERLNDLGEPLGYDAIRRCVAEHGTHGPGGMVAALVGLGETWSGGTAQQDDITVVVVRRLAADGLTRGGPPVHQGA
jgi:sigma-B regulation protein RsbU (phosphoserine phosphatase)